MVSNLYYRYLFDQHRPRYVNPKKKPCISVPRSAPLMPMDDCDTHTVDVVPQTTSIEKKQQRKQRQQQQRQQVAAAGDNNQCEIKSVVSVSSSSSLYHPHGNCRIIVHDNNVLLTGMKRLRSQIKKRFINALELSPLRETNNVNKEIPPVKLCPTRSTITAATAFSSPSIRSPQLDQQQQQPYDDDNNDNRKNGDDDDDGIIIPLDGISTTLLAPRINAIHESIDIPLLLPHDYDDDDDNIVHGYQRRREKNDRHRGSRNTSANTKDLNCGGEVIGIPFLQCCLSADSVG